MQDKYFEEGISLANDSKYGLGANIYTTDLSEGITASEIAGWYGLGKCTIT